MQTKILLFGFIIISLFVFFIADSGQPYSFAATKTTAKSSVGNSTDIDWWPMFQHDAAHTGYSTSSAPDLSETRFVVNYTTGHNGGLIVVDDKLIMSGGNAARGLNHSLYSINATSGRFLWASAERFHTDAIPAVFGNSVVVQSAGILYRFRVDDGIMLWKFQYSRGGYGNLPSPIIHDGIVFFSSGTTGVIDPRGSMFALSLLEMENTTSPKLIWEKPLDSVRTSTPAYSNGRILLSYSTSEPEEYVVCLNATNGAQIWQRSRLYPSSASAPAVVDGRVYFGSVTGNVLCLDELTGELLWSTQLHTEVRQQHVDASPAVANRRVFVGTLAEVVIHAKFFSLNATNGQILWEYQADRMGEPFNSSPAVADGKVFVSAGRRTYAFSETSGDLIWSYERIGGSLGSCVGGPAIASGSVYVLDSAGYIYCFNTKLHFNITIDPEFFDNRGESLVPPPSSWNILFPNGTRKTASSVETYYGPMGTYSIESVAWKGFEVLRSPVSVLLDSNMTWSPRIDCVLPTSISISLSSTTSYIGFKVGINGNLTCNEIGVSDAAILLSYSVTVGESWNDITLVDTTSNGRYSAVWMPQATGNYVVKAVWAGNSTYPGAVNTVNLAVITFEEQNVFSVTSNSTVSALAFNATSRELSFTVTGSSGTTGYVNVYIAKALVENAGDFKVYLNGTQIDYTTMSTDDSWLLHFTYQHSTYKVTITLARPSTSFIETPFGKAIIYIVPTTAVAILIALYALRKRAHARVIENQEKRIKGKG